MVYTVIIIIAAAGIAALIFWRLKSRGRRAGSSRTEQALLKVCFGDSERAERLIRYEISRAPGISRKEAADRAVWRYQRDNA
ncbi:MAG: hypothetical protein JW913_17780 [Chitinispirillaceae bacterium]|nr:hypothetical protein [Chitinispirillaceae bacterium]